MALPINIDDLLTRGENLTLELKLAAKGLPSSIWETYSAFANTNGGTIVLGVQENQNRTNRNERCVIAGVNNAENLLKDFWNTINNSGKISKNLLTNEEVQVVDVDGKQLIVINVPQADFSLRPVYINGNPLTGTYKRNHEGDYRCTEEEVKTMLADAQSQKHSYDSEMLPNYTIDDIDLATLRAYRQRFLLRAESHPWNEVDDLTFLTKIGAYRIERETGEKGLTRAGVLMFGKYDSITEPNCTPWYFPDYQEWLGADDSQRWTDRVYPNGTWEANLYQFFHLVYTKLAQYQPTKFALKGIERVDDTSAHVAIREALVNTLVHCNYAVRGNILIKRTAQGIIMRNPGRMLVSIEDFYAGSHSMCRNPLIQKMFMLLGYGERAGSGADIIVKGWQKYNWERPKIEESIQPEETMLLMPMNVGIRRVSSLKDSLGVPSVPSVPSNVPSLFQVVTKLYQLVPSMTDLQYEKALNVILALTEGDLSMQSLMSHVGVSNRSRFRKDVIAPLIQIGFISPTIADKPNSPDQTYQLTQSAHTLLQPPAYITDPQSL